MTYPPNIVEKGTYNQLPEDELMARCQELFSDEICRELERRCPSTVRARLTVKVLIVCVLYFVVARLRSFCDVHSTLNRSGIWMLRPIQVKKQAFFQRFTALSDLAMVWLINALYSKSQSLVQPHAQQHPALKWAAFAHSIVSIDDSVIDQIQRKYFVREQPHDGTRFMDSLPGRISVLFEIATGLICQAEYHDDPQENEKVHARPLLEKLSAGCLVLMDLGYFSFSLFDWLTEHFTYFISRMRKGTSYIELASFVETPLVRDKLIYLGAYRSDMAAYPVRLVEVFVDGQWWRYITNVIDPIMLPAHHLFALYNQRWSIERLFSVLKEVLGLSRLRLCHLQGVRWQIWGTMLAYQVVQTIRCELADKLKVQQWQLSWEQFFAAHIAYYREALGKTRLSLLQWMVKHHKSLGLIKPKRKSERKVTQLPPEIAQTYETLQVALLPDLKPRKPRYARRKCGRGKHRNLKIHEKKKIIAIKDKKT